LDQSQRYLAEAQQAGGMVKLVVHPGGGHGWLSMLWDVRQFGKWFDLHLRQPAK
jgi:acetyl esterase/lipase